VISSYSLGFEGTNYAGFSGERRSTLQGARVFQRETPGEIMEKERCPLRCEEKLRGIFTSLGYDGVPKDVKVPVPKSTDANTTETGYLDHNPRVWCSDSTYLASLYLCLQQHCTPTIAQMGWAAAGKACEGGIPTEAVIRQNMQLKVIEVGDIEAPEGAAVDWTWTKLWGGLTHNQVGRYRLGVVVVDGWILRWLLWCLASSQGGDKFQYGKF